MHSSTKYLINLKNVEYKLTEKTILENINFQVKNNQIITIIGPNGSGKTTLARIISGVCKPTSGEIQFDVDLRIGYVPQKFYVIDTMPITVRDFLGFYTKDKGHIKQLISLLRIDHIMDYQIARISGGELQRLLLARALLNKPNLLILDEPAQGLDLPGQIEFYKLISEFKDNYNISIVLVSHDLHFVMRTSNTVLCLNKHLCCIGTPEEISESDIYLQLFGQGAKEILSIYKHHHDHKHS